MQKNEDSFVKHEPELDLGLLVLPPLESDEGSDLSDFSENAETDATNAQMTKTYQCDLCSFSSTNKAFMELHWDYFKQHRPVYCAFCSKKFRTRRAMSYHLEGKKDCWPCEADFGCPSLLLKHINEKHLVKVETFERSMCRKSVENSQTPSCRQDTVKTSEPEHFECDLCNYKTFVKRNLKAHFKIHLKDRAKDLTCSRCGKTFLYKQNMNRHLANKPSNCFYCDESFQCYNLLMMHLKSEHKASVKNWPCETCGRSFARMFSLKSHQKQFGHGKFVLTSSDNYEGTTCLKSFTLKQLCQRQNVHDEVVDQNCQIRSVEFRSTENSELHLENHKKMENFEVHLKARHSNGLKEAARRNVSESNINTKLEHPRKMLQPSARIEEPKNFFKILDKNQLRSHVTSHLEDHLRRFICNKCGQKFVTHRSLKIHLQLKPRKCFYCDEEFRCAVLRKKHLKLKHNVWDKSWPCGACPKIFRQAEGLRYHQQRCVHRKFASTSSVCFKCKICSKSVKLDQSCQQHIKTSHGDVEKNLCEICSVTFKSATKKITQKSVSESFNNIKLKPLVMMLRSSPQIEESKSFECDMCNYETFDKCKLRSHVTSHLKDHLRRFHCNRCGKNFVKEKTLINHLKLKPRKCFYCDEELACELLRTKHLRLKHNAWGSNWPFDTSGKSSTKVQNLRSNPQRDQLKFATTPSVNFKCVVCEFPTKYRKVLVRHVKLTHIEVRETSKINLIESKTNTEAQLQSHVTSHLKLQPNSFTCNECGKHCHTKYRLSVHLRPKKCFYCDADFKCELSIKAHLQVKHKAWEKNWPCETCRFSFTTLVSLKSHQKLRTHGKSASTFSESFECKICQKSFRKKQYCSKHMKRVHGEVNNRNCQICSVMFRSAENLKLHLENHQKVQIFRCGVCEYTTQYRFNFVKHLEQRHNEIYTKDNTKKFLAKRKVENRKSFKPSNLINFTTDKYA